MITMTLLWSSGPEPAHLAAAAVAIPFYWWFLGWRRPPEPNAGDLR